MYYKLQYKYRSTKCIVCIVAILQNQVSMFNMYTHATRCLD